MRQRSSARRVQALAEQATGVPLRMPDGSEAGAQDAPTRCTPDPATGEVGLLLREGLDGELVRVGHMVSVLEEAGFEVRDVQSSRKHHGRTLRARVARLAERWDDAVALVGERRARVWRLSMTGSAVAFDAARIDVDQVLAVRLGPGGSSGAPPVREARPADRRP